MGHIRLGVLPHSPKWKEVVKLLEGDGSLSDIAQASFNAALAGLKKVPSDPGFTQALTEIFNFAEAAKSKNFIESLQQAGFDVSTDATVLDLVGSLRQRIDMSFRLLSNRTDLPEIAANAFGESLLGQTTAQLPSLFGTPPQTSQETVRQQLTGARFKGLMHEFYSVFTRRYLSYYLSRELSRHSGGPEARFGSIDSHTAFNLAFDTYVRQSVRIADEFTPGWFGKTSYQDGISHQSVSRYAHVAFKKISSEFRRGNDGGNGE